MKIEYEYLSSLTKILDLCLWIHINYDVYEGNWVENFWHGIGKIVYKDKGTYYGEWSKGKAQLSNKCATEYSYWFFNYKIIISIFLNFSDKFKFKFLHLSVIGFIKIKILNIIKQDFIRLFPSFWILLYRTHDSQIYYIKLVFLFSKSVIWNFNNLNLMLNFIMNWIKKILW